MEINQYNNTLFTLFYSKHAKERMTERVGFLQLVPRLVKVTENNFISEEEGKLRIRLSYNQREDVILIIHPYMNNNTAKVITFFFKKKRKHKNSRETIIKQGPHITIGDVIPSHEKFDWNQPYNYI